jgi:RimJ/RimL family protein N-acetyltransferase
VRYTLINFPDADFPHPEIGFSLPDASARGSGLASEAVSLLVDYLFAGYDVPRISAITDLDNLPAQKLLQATGFQREGTLRKASFRDGEWRDMLIYGLLRVDSRIQSR